MAQPTKYTRSNDFTTRNPDQVDLAAINSELDAISSSVNQIIDALGLVQMDDGRLGVGVVSYDALDADAQKRLQPIPGKDGRDGVDGKNGKDGAKGDVGASFEADYRGSLSERPLFDGYTKGFSFLAMDQGKLYFKLSDASGDWSSGYTYGKGDQGEPGINGVDGLPGAPGIPGADGVDGRDGKDGKDGAVIEVDTTQHTTSIIGKRYVKVKLALVNGKLSLVLDTAA